MKLKITAALLAAVSMLTLASCGDNSHKFTSTEKDEQIVAQIKSDDGSEDIKYEEYRYFFMNNKRDLYGSDTALDSDMVNNIKQHTENNIRKHHAVKFAAKMHDVEFTSEEEKENDEYTARYRESQNLTDDSYALLLEHHYVTDGFFSDLNRTKLLSDKLYTKLSENGVLPNGDHIANNIFTSDDILCIGEIFVNHNGGETIPIARTRAEEALEKLDSGVDFNEVMLEYSNYENDPTVAEHGRYTAEYDALEPVWIAATELTDGEHSRVIESAYGFHIVKRLPKDMAYMEENRADIVDMYRMSEFNRYLEDLAGKLTVTYTDQGNNIDLANMT